MINKIVFIDEKDVFRDAKISYATNYFKERAENVKIFVSKIEYLDIKKQFKLLRETHPITLSYSTNNYLPYLAEPLFNDINEAFLKLERLWKEDCLLKNTCKVFWNLARSSGNLSPKYLIVGLNPGFGDYLKTGEWGCFWTGSGPSTLTLRETLHKLGILWTSWLTNLVRCSTQNNSVPELDEVNNCYNNWLKDEIEILKPQKIFVLGSDTAKFVSALNVDFIPIKHPAYYYRKGIKDEYYKEFEKYI